MKNFNRRIQLPFERMEAEKRSLINFISTLPKDIYLKQPDKSQWSIAQASNHLLLSERFSLAYLKKKLSYPQAVPPYHIRSLWNKNVYRFIFRFVKAKAPQNINMWNDQRLLLPSELDDEWSSLRKEMYAYIREQYPNFKTNLVYNHPFAGRLTWKQTLNFFADHIRHHMKQIKRTEKEMMKNVLRPAS